MDIKSINWETLSWTPVREGIERKTFGGDGATVALNRLWPGHEVNPHSHPHEQIVYILQGTADFCIGTETLRLGPGQLAVVPPNVTHYARQVGEEPVLNLDIFTPARPEYYA